LAIVRAVVGLTKALGGITNADGVETFAQAEILRAEGCSEAQGYFFGRPMPGDRFDTLLCSGLSVPDLNRYQDEPIAFAAVDQTT
jgi:EAL domain-containing protein (putative c-di-GMP-specific phosphodiesterase class I)